MNMRRILFRLGTVLVLVAIAACMMVIGRGHTMYFDNKKLEYEGGEVDAVRRINVFVDGEQVAKLSAKERGMATFTGQTLKFNIEVVREKGADPELYDYSVKVPYGEDGLVINLPALIEGLPQETYMTVFVPAARLALETLADASTDEDGRVMFTVAYEYTGSGKLTFVWQSLDESTEGAEWTDIEGADGTSYEVPAADMDAQLGYRCVVSDGTLTETTNAAHVSEQGASNSEESF